MDGATRRDEIARSQHGKDEKRSRRKRAVGGLAFLFGCLSWDGWANSIGNLYKHSCYKDYSRAKKVPLDLVSFCTEVSPEQ